MKKVTGHLTCPICLDLYKKPKYLPCYHSYCEECLVKLVVQSMITCPECRKTHVVPSGGVTQLPDNFFINRLLNEIAQKKCVLCVCGEAVEVQCLDCDACLCACCFDKHKYSKESQSHNMMPLNESQSKNEGITTNSNFAMCQEHRLELKFYCETCDQLVCHNCITNEHTNHDCDTVKKMATKHRRELEKIMEPVEKMVEELSVSQKKLRDTRDKIKTQADDIDKEINRYYIELQQRLHQQRNNLKEKLHETARQKMNDVMSQLVQMDQTQAQLESVKELNSAMKNGSDQEVLLMKVQVVDDVKRIRDSYNKLDTRPVKSATMEFVPVEEYKIFLPQFGHLLDEACPLKSKAVYPQSINKGNNFYVKVVTKDQFNNLCPKGGSQVVIRAQSSRGVTPLGVKDNKDGSYLASFVADQVGEVKLSVIINGRQINGGPFNVKVFGKYTTLGMPDIVMKGGKMGALWGIAFGRDGMWAATDESNHCVWIYNRENQLLRKFGRQGYRCGEFDRPVGIVFDADYHLYVTDIDNHRVQKFDISGAYVLQFGTQGSGYGQLKHPLGIAFHKDKLYVTEWSNHRVSVFQLDGQFYHIIGLGHLHNPRYIAVSNNDHLLVANKGDHCISIFTLDGNYVGKFGTQGTGLGQLNNPSGIATDANGFVFVTERGNNRVSIFDKDGVYIHSFGSQGSGHGQFSLPYGIAISPTGDIYISDARNKRIQIFYT